MELPKICSHQVGSTVTVPSKLLTEFVSPGTYYCGIVAPEERDDNTYRLQVIAPGGARIWTQWLSFDLKAAPEGEQEKKTPIDHAGVQLTFPKPSTVRCGKYTVSID